MHVAFAASAGTQAREHRSFTPAHVWQESLHTQQASEGRLPYANPPQIAERSRHEPGSRLLTLLLHPRSLYARMPTATRLRANSRV